MKISVQLAEALLDLLALVRLDVEHPSIVNAINDEVLPLYFEAELTLLVVMRSVEENRRPCFDDVDFFVGNLDLEEVERVRQDVKEVVAEGEHHSAVQQKRVFQLD